jgi:hypothetical protein
VSERLSKGLFQCGKLLGKKQKLTGVKITIASSLIVAGSFAKLVIMAFFTFKKLYLLLKTAGSITPRFSQVAAPHVPVFKSRG